MNLEAYLWSRRPLWNRSTKWERAMSWLCRDPKQRAAFGIKLLAFRVIARGWDNVRCANCGDERVDVLHADHINHDGHRHRKEIGKGGKGAGKRVYHWILTHRKEARGTFQLLCSNCHTLKTVYKHCTGALYPIDLEKDAAYVYRPNRRRVRSQTGTKGLRN